MPSYLPYDEPTVAQLLTISSFLYLLNVTRYIVDKLIYAGLIGEIALGVVYGTPLAAILAEAWEETLTVLGYIGLVLIVFEGGLDIHASLLVQNLPLSTICALTGIALPIGLSMLLLHVGFGYPLIQAFTAGAALSSTSLGTTFFVLQSQGVRSDDLKAWSQTRIGTVLLSAALMDDIVGLVLLSVVTALGQATDSNAIGWNVGRPLLATSALFIVVPPLWLYTVKPAYRWCIPLLGRMSIARQEQFLLLLVISAISGLTAAAYFAGSSMLLGAFLAGAILRTLPDLPDCKSIEEVYRTQIGQLNEYLFTPLFFASIGFAIPFLQLWTGSILWRGICYALLMMLAKVLVGIWILVWERVTSIFSKLAASLSSLLHARSGLNLRQSRTSTQASEDVAMSTKPETVSNGQAEVEAAILPSSDRDGTLSAASLLGLALVARGEIGILIAQVAHSENTNENPIFPDEPFLLAIWATVLCTVVGPITVGCVVGRYGQTIFRSQWG